MPGSARAPDLNSIGRWAARITRHAKKGRIRRGPIRWTREDFLRELLYVMRTHGWLVQM